MAEQAKEVGVEAYLEKLLETQKIPHLLLFSGESGAAETLAVSFAKRLLQTESDTHPDLYFYRPEGKLGMHSIDKMRLFCQDVRLMPYLANYRVFIIIDAERMPLTSSNALLKTFEEPISTSIILLVTSKESSLLPTVRSRCQRVQVPGKKAQDKITKELVDLLKSLSERALSDFQGEAKRLAELFSEEEQIQAVEGETAYLKAEREKREEGRVALKASQEKDRLLTSILHFYRDLELVRFGGEKEQLYFPEVLHAYQHLLERGALPSLDRVEAILNDVALRLDRSHPRDLAFEAMLHALYRLY